MITWTTLILSSRFAVQNQELCWVLKFSLVQFRSSRCTCHLCLQTCTSLAKHQSSWGIRYSYCQRTRCQGCFLKLVACWASTRNSPISRLVSSAGWRQSQEAIHHQRELRPDIPELCSPFSFLPRSLSILSSWRRMEVKLKAQQQWNKLLFRLSVAHQ